MNEVKGRESDIFVNSIEYILPSEFKIKGIDDSNFKEPPVNNLLPDPSREESVDELGVGEAWSPDTVYEPESLLSLVGVSLAVGAREFVSSFFELSSTGLGSSFVASLSFGVESFYMASLFNEELSVYAWVSLF